MSKLILRAAAIAAIATFVADSSRVYAGDDTKGQGSSQAPMEHNKLPNDPSGPTNRAESTDHADHAGRLEHKAAMQSWPESIRKAAADMTAKYGEPTATSPTGMCWSNKGAFTEITLMNTEIAHDFPVSHKDYLQHAVAYKVPAEKVGELAMFDGSIIVDRTRGTLAARCDTEAHNLLALNLANDVVTGKKTADAARQTFTEIVKGEVAGTQHAYLTKLQFQPQMLTQTGDKDRTTGGLAGVDSQPMDRADNTTSEPKR